MYKPKILLVDDESMIRRIYERILQKQGMQVYGAADGVEGLETMRQLSEQGIHLDVCITDVVMPRMSGIDMIRTIRQNNFDGLSPWIVMTGYAADNDVHSVTPFKILAKPFGMDDFLETVYSALKCSPNPEADHYLENLRKPQAN